MKKLFSLFVASLLTFSAFSAEDKTLLFDNATKSSGAKYNVSNSSEFPHMFRIVNWGNGMMYRIFDVEKGPVVENYSGLEIVFDYSDPFDVPADLQFFFSGTGFVPGSYPFVSDLMSVDEAVATINFADYPHLTALEPGTPFNRFGFRNGGDQGVAANPDEGIEEVLGSVIDVKIKSMVLITKDGTREYFDILGGGVYSNPKDSYRLYGESMSMTFAFEGEVSWEVEETCKYANVHLNTPLTAAAAENIAFFTNDYDELAIVKGNEEGSSLIVVNAETIATLFIISSNADDVQLDVKEIVLSDTEGAGSSGFDSVSADKELPAFVNVYSINGQLMKMNVAREKALDGLAQGAYLINNKKVLVF